MWRTGIATVSLSGDLADKLAAIAAAGFDGVEIFEADFLAFDCSPAELGRMIRDAGLAPILFQPFRDFEGLPAPHRQRAFDRAERKFDVMQQIGTNLMLVCSSVSPLALGGVDRAADDLAELGERAAKRQLRVGFEALAWGRFINDHRDAWEVVRRANHSSVGIILDSFHTLSKSIPIDSIRSIPKEKLFLVQIADAPRMQLDTLQWSRHFRNFPGQGDLDLSGFANAVLDTGFDGYWSLEVFNDHFRAGTPRTIAIDGKRSLDLLEDRTRDLSRSSRFPARANCHAIDFIEFAVNDAEARELRHLFSVLGFFRSAVHIRKDVELWSQGDVKFVINREAEGFAHSYHVTHGPSVCAIGMRVDDSASAIARARALQASAFTQDVAPEEIPLPAIRGVGGSLLYLMEERGVLSELWHKEFRPTTEAPTDFGIHGVDHIAQSMDYEESLSAVLFYTSIFDLENLSAVEIPDPGGLVQSQVVQDPEGRIRFTLNASKSHRTMSGRFVDQFFGAGVHHIALGTSDLRATADRMRAAGLHVLAISKNYYDDLQARFGLDDAITQELAARNILYDRDEVGEYLQLYTPAFADRFFFEVVERRGYAGFGASNAAIRLAAQRRMHKPFRSAD